MNHSINLDIGCGLNKITPDSIGIDKKDWKKPNIVGSVLNLPIKANSLNSITLLEVIEHFDKENQMLILSEIKRILKQDGRLVISMPNISKWWGFPYRIIWKGWELTVQKEYRHEHIGMFREEYMFNLLSRYFNHIESHRIALLDRLFVCQ